jgi:asparagine synthase (glutamine-hydrolysing)
MRFILSLPRHLAASTPSVVARAGSIDTLSQPFPQIWIDADVPVVDLGEAGCILGVLFSRSGATRLERLPAEAPTGGEPDALARWLARECWGGYVAVCTGGRRGGLDIFVDPSGLCPVYRAETTTHILLASHPVLLAQAGAQLAVSWSALRSYLARSELRRRTTCLAGVTELAPGELVPASDRRDEGRRIWRPEAFMPDSAAPSFGEAAEELRGIAVPVIGGWARQFGRVAVAASGGVDSSFICAALARADAPFACATVATADPSGDERRFVQRLAGHLGVEAIPALYDPATMDPRRSVSAGLARPSRKPFMAALEAALFEAAGNADAAIVFDGNGGDNLFCFLHSSAPFVDRLRCEGPGRGALSTFLDMCRITGCDVPAMARASLRRLSRRGRLRPWPVDTGLLCASADQTDDVEPLTRWLDAAVACHWGKHEHLMLVMRAQLHIHGLGSDGLPRFSPLASQPLLEYCLRIPTWLWCTGGINRALARAAFAADLPAEILCRTSKAGPDSFIRRSFAEHRGSIGELLMDGLLARHDVIDRQAIEIALRADPLSGGEIVLRLLDLAEAENWARSWTA